MRRVQADNNLMCAKQALKACQSDWESAQRILKARNAQLQSVIDRSSDLARVISNQKEYIFELEQQNDVGENMSSDTIYGEETPRIVQDESPANMFTGMGQEAAGIHLAQPMVTPPLTTPNRFQAGQLRIPTPRPEGAAGDTS